jgi:site-specific DNA recombinase
MSVFGGMSKGERQRVKIRVRAAMGAQAQIEGRFLGGRPPFGYRIADAGPHPNPAKAAGGRRLHRLELDDFAAPVVARIFAEFLDDHGLYAIAEGLTRDGIPSPSAYDRARNSHRSGIAWSKSAVRAILTNPRYTGRQVWNRQRKDEVLLDVANVALGHVTKERWNPPQDWIWSETAAQPQIVSAEVFSEAQRVLQGRGGKPTTRTKRPAPRTYLLRGLICCGACDRRMNANWANKAVYYRCRFPQEYALANSVSHPLNVYIREDRLVPRLDRWLATVFDDDVVERTLDQLDAAQQMTTGTDALIAAIRREIADADRKLGRHRAALEAGADPAVVAGRIQEVQSARFDAQHRLEQIRPAAAPTLDRDQLAAAIRELGDMVKLLSSASPERKARIYAGFGILLTYHQARRQVQVSQAPLRSDMGQRFVSEGGSTPFPHAWVYLQTCLCAEPEVMFGDALQETSHLSGRQGEAEQPTGRNEVSGTVNGSGSTSA